jgi:hypothetical protein
MLTGSNARPAARAALACAALAVGTAACDEPTPTEDCDPGVTELRFTDADDPLVFPRLRDARSIALVGVRGCGGQYTPLADDVTWSSADPGVVSVRPIIGATEGRGWVESVDFGATTIAAQIGSVRGELEVQVVRPPTEGSGFTVIDSGRVSRYTTDLWVHGEHAYSGSLPWRCPTPCEETGLLYVWRVTADGGLARVDSLELPAPKVNDVKISADGAFAVATLERAADGQNGIVILDLADPAAPAITAVYTDGLEHGVHNTWIERIDGRDYVFTVEDATAPDGGVHVIDATDRAAPTTVASYHAGSSFPHDVYVRDGLAFVSHWNAGLVILDVGNGMAGGSPTAPAVVSIVETGGGHVHNAWYWPEGRVVFVGEERFPPPDRIDEVGVVHVVDVTDLTAPVEVATYGVPGASPHNFWMDEDRGILFVGWYENGLRAIDVTGELAGDLSGQGRELGYLVPSGHRGAGSIWAPQPHDGVIYLSDIYNGLWAVRFDR